jgi:tetratricopeptide (TPR) repeat protein
VVEAKARGDAGQYDAALPLAADAVTRARALGYPPALAEALHRRGVIEGFAGDADAADATLEEALLVAATAKDDALAASAWDDRLHVIGWMRGRPDEALRLRSVAEAAVRRAGDAPLAVARLDHVVGTVLVGAERPADAVPYLERAVAGKSASAGPDAIDVAVSLNSLAVAHMELGQYDLAEREYARVLATWERTLGPDHPHVAGVLNNLANLARDRGDEATAITRYTRSLAIRERAYGPDHPLVADSRDNLGISLGATGDLAGALREQTRALTIREQTLGPDHYDVSYSAMNLGSTYQALGRYADAEASYRRALRLAEQALGADSAELAYSLNGLAVALLSLARPAECWSSASGALALGGSTPDDVGERQHALRRGPDADRARTRSSARAGPGPRRRRGVHRRRRRLRPQPRRGRRLAGHPRALVARPPLRDRRRSSAIVPRCRGRPTTSTPPRWTAAHRRPRAPTC